MIAERKAKIGLRYLGLAVLVGLVVLSLVFYLERACFLDFAFQSFQLIQQEWFAIQVNRFGVVLVQFLPLLALWAKAPLGVVLGLYSVSIPLLFVLCFILAVWPLRSLWMGWTLVLTFTLIVLDGFYWATSEFQQGLAILFVFFAALQRYPRFRGAGHALLLLAGLVALAFYHPLIFIPFYFLLGYFRMELPGTDRRLLLGLGGGMAGILLIKRSFFGNWYDRHKTSAFFEHLTGDFPDYFSYNSHWKFLENSLQYWYFLPILALMLTGWYAWKGRWFRLAYVWAFSLGYLMLLHISSPEATYRFYAEVNYYPLVIFFAAPLWREVYPEVVNRKLLSWLLLLLALVSAWRLAAIGRHYRVYHQRLVWIEGQLEKMRTSGQNRKVLSPEEVPMDTLLISWSLPYESLYLSVLKDGPDQARTLLLPEGGQTVSGRDTFESVFQQIPFSKLNPRYFHFRIAEEENPE